MTAPREHTTDPAATSRDLRGYLEMLSGNDEPDALLEVRYRLEGRRMAARFYPIARTARLARAIIRLGSERDVYVGCAPRIRRHGGRDAVAHAHVLWADCDTLEASEKLATFQPPPSTVIKSGSRHGRHAYWSLQRPLAAADIETANTRLGHALGADPACCDPSRILRPPGTRSFKYTPPVPVIVERLEPTKRYSADDIVGRLPDIPAREAHVTPRETADDGLLSIAPDRYVLALLGAYVPPDRKVSCPFHTDTHASLHVYPTAEAGWFCFSCRRGGSIYDLAAPLWELDTRGYDFRTLRARLLEVMAVQENGRLTHDASVPSSRAGDIPVEQQGIVVDDLAQVSFDGPGRWSSSVRAHP